MRRGGQWIERLKAGLTKSGFVIRDIAPRESAAAKRRERRNDNSRIGQKRVTSAQIQAANSLFPGASVHGRIVSFSPPTRKR